MHVSLQRFELDDATHGRVPCTMLSPDAEEALPLSVFLFGGGGSAELLDTLAPFFTGAWSSGAIPRMHVACAGVAPWCFYLDDPATGMAWETVVAEGLVDRVCSRQRVPAIGLVGVSMGGYGALKIAFARPDRFRAVAAIAPMIEPALEADAVPLRNRYHYPPEVPQRLLGMERDRELYAKDHPIARLRGNVAAILRHDLAVYVDAGSRDQLHAHDGAELLHRALWSLDVPHEHHLLRDADHVGPTLVPRLERAFAWVGARLEGGASEPSAEERALRAMLEPARAAATERDSTMTRTYGLFPEPG